MLANAMKGRWICHGRWIIAVAALVATAPGVNAGSGDARTGKNRLIAGSAASVAGTGSSAGHQLYVVGGSGAAVGIAASANTTIVAGNSTIDPPVRIFSGNFEAY